MKNRGSHSKAFTAGNAAMHGVMAAELASRGFTANEDIFDTDIGAARLMNLEYGDAEAMLQDLGKWHMAEHGSNLRLHASCMAGHWSAEAMRELDGAVGRFEIPESLRGVVVTRVDPTGPANLILRRNFVILEINRRPTPTVAEYERLVAAARPGDVVAVYYYDPQSHQRALATVTVE